MFLYTHMFKCGLPGEAMRTVSKVDAVGKAEKKQSWEVPYSALLRVQIKTVKIILTVILILK